MSGKRRIVDIIEARMASSRLPGKVMKPFLGKPMLQFMIERLKRSTLLDGIVVATTTSRSDDVLEDLAESLGVGCYRGSEDDVLMRVLEAAQAFDVDVIVETPGDCPLIDWQILDHVVQHYLDHDDDYVSNNLELTYAGGMDVQVFSTEVLADVARRTDDPVDHEHVSLFIYRNPDDYRVRNVAAPPHLNAPDVKCLLDTQADYKLICAVLAALYPETPAFTCADILALIAERPELREINRHVERTQV